MRKVRRLREEQEPERVYLDDPDSWVYRAPGVSAEERAKLSALRTELWTERDVERIRQYKEGNYRKGRGRKKKE